LLSNQGLGPPLPAEQLTAPTGALPHAHQLANV